VKHHPNIILIAGNGRNVGKTLLSCRIIKHLAETSDVYGVKISSHFHELDREAQIINETYDFRIVQETLTTRKDSSRMLRAGAREVFYVQCKNASLSEMFSYLQTYLPMDKPVIIESGGLYNILEPGIFYYIKGKDDSKEKIVRDGGNRTIVSPENVLELDIENIFQPLGNL